MGLAAQAGLFAQTQRVALIGAPVGIDTSVFDDADLIVVQDRMPDAQLWQGRGIEVHQSVQDQPVDLAIVFVPRAKGAARDLIARACLIAKRVVVDGAKTDGVEALLKELRKRTDVQGTVSKAHGKLFWFDALGLDEWLAESALLDGRWSVRPGVFSADGVDPGSAALASALPDTLSGVVADLGAGWGYLSAEVLARCPKITAFHLVEAQASALDCARINVTDNRAAFHWADATDWGAPGSMDTVVMNPPFHTGRAADTGLGQQFIDAAARLLRRGGTLWMVANRHLPYEATLNARFGDVTEIGGDTRYKLFMARKLR